jgi:hypothetical protein
MTARNTAGRGQIHTSYLGEKDRSHRECSLRDTHRKLVHMCKHTRTHTLTHANTHTHICVSLHTYERERGTAPVTDVERGGAREEYDEREDSEDTCFSRYEDTYDE